MLEAGFVLLEVDFVDTCIHCSFLDLSRIIHKFNQPHNDLGLYYFYIFNNRKKVSLKIRLKRPSNDIFSHKVAPILSSALSCFTSEFGMESGGTKTL